MLVQFIQFAHTTIDVALHILSSLKVLTFFMLTC